MKLPQDKGEWIRPHWAIETLGISTLMPRPGNLCSSGFGGADLIGDAEGSWFDNLLPDSELINRGAMQLLQPNQLPSGIDGIEAKPLTDVADGRKR